MKKLLCTAIISIYSFVAYTAQPVILGAKAPTTTPITGKTPIAPITQSIARIPDVYIHNAGNKPFTLNSISFPFFINGQKTEQAITYKIKVKPNKTKKITGAKITFNLPETTGVSSSGISEININNNQSIKISNLTDPNTISTSIHIYLTNTQGAWKEIAQPNVLTPKAKAITAKAAPDAKSVVAAPKTSTLKSTTVAVKVKAKNLPKSKTAKAVQTTVIPTQPKNAIITPDITNKIN